MTIVSQIIIDAYRQSNLLAIGADPTDDQMSEALRYLNRLVKSVYGFEAGEQYQPFPIGRNGITTPQGWPWYDNVPPKDWYVPKNKRLMLNLSATSTVYLNPLPDDGSRIAITDVSGNLGTNSLILAGNGNLIEGVPSLTLNTNGLEREWFYRQDLGNWVKLADLSEDDTFPFPESFDDMFITLLAMRLNPSYGVALDQQSLLVLTRNRSQFRARYAQHIQVGSELGLVRMPRADISRDTWAYWWGYGDPTSAFNAGYPYGSN